MNKSRKHVKNVLSSIRSLKNKYENNKDDIVRLTNHAEYGQIAKHFDTLISKLSNELQSLPIGYRYSGTFYLKKPYVFPATFEKYSGVIFMPEDLISWQIESGMERQDYSYHQHIFKEPSTDRELTREDAEPIY